MIAKFEDGTTEKQFVGSAVKTASSSNNSGFIGATVAIIATVVLFFAGFVLGEDGFGGNIRADLYLFHGPTIRAFRDRPVLDVLPDYNSATTPLFHILESFNPLLDHDTAFRFTNTLFALFTCGLFIYAMYRRFELIPSSGKAASLIGISILFSPYYRAESYWVSTDILPLFLMILTAILLDPIQDGDPRSRLTTNLWVILPLALASWACFYCRQTALFLPFYAFVILFWRFRTYWWWIVLVFGLLGMPMVYLIHIWKGLTPPGFRRHEGLSMDSIVQPLSMILIYALPFLLHSFNEMKNSVFRTMKHRSTWLYLLAGLAGFIAIFRNFHFYEANRGGGIASKFLAHYGEPGRYFFLMISYLGLLIVLSLCRRASWRGRTLMVSFLLPSFVMTFFFQRYYDPVLVVLFFLLWQWSAASRFLTARMGYILIGFNAALLVGALSYNARTGTVFLPLASHPHPWNEIKQY